MTISFIYPSDPFNPKKVDEAFERESKAVSGFAKIYLVNTDDIGIKQFALESQERLVYRGWMLTQEKYTELFQKANTQLYVGIEEYLSNHHLPNWYRFVEDITPKTIITTQDNALADFDSSGWPQAFIKDYVKSLKTGSGSIVSSKNQLRQTLEDMVRYRGFIEGGVLLREVKDFLPESETRFFVVNGQVYAPNNSNISTQKIELAHNVAQRFHDKKFYSVDIATTKNQENLLVEIGDGQVSDLVGWNLNDFIAVLQAIKNEPQYLFSSKKKI